LSEDHLDEDIAALEEFTAAGLVTVADRKVRFDAPLKMLVRSVATVFDRYARGPADGHRYSRVA
jgi:oxygen-independent coproporphyrinogen-3 oxidase